MGKYGIMFYKFYLSWIYTSGNDAETNCVIIDLLIIDFWVP
jgi:hypothetical protein